MAGEKGPQDTSGVDARAAQSPILPDFEQAVVTVETVMDLAQTHLVDRFPNIIDIGLTDPEDGSHWTIDLTRRNAAGKLSSVRLYNPDDADRPELFQIGSRMLTRPSAVPMITTDHVINETVASDKETPLETVALAEARLRNLLGVPEESEQAEQSQAFEQVYADLETYFGDQLLPPTNKLVDYTLDEGAEWDLMYDFFAADILELLEGEDIHMPSPESGFPIPVPEPDTAFIRLSDDAQGRVIRLGFTFFSFSNEDIPVAKASTDFGIEINLAKADGTFDIYESHTSLVETPQGAEERVKTEKAQPTPDQMRNIARILDKYSHSGSITYQATRRYG